MNVYPKELNTGIRPVPFVTQSGQSFEKPVYLKGDLFGVFLSFLERVSWFQLPAIVFFLCILSLKPIKQCFHFLSFDLQELFEAFVSSMVTSRQRADSDQQSVDSGSAEMERLRVICGLSSMHQQLLQERPKEAEEKRRRDCEFEREFAEYLFWNLSNVLLNKWLADGSREKSKKNLMNSDKKFNSCGWNVVHATMTSHNNVLNC